MLVGFCLENLVKIPRLLSRSISAENPRGEKGKGGMAKSKLGIGRKGSPAITLKAGDSKIIA